MQGDTASPHTNFSVHSGIDYIPCGSPARELPSGIGLYDNKSRGHRNFFVFRFQLIETVFALGTDINWDSSVHTIFQKGIF